MSNSQLYENENEIPAAASETVDPEDTIHASGWWASHALIWPAVIAGFFVQVGAFIVMDSFGGLIGAVATAVALGVGLLYFMINLSAWIGYYKEAKLARRTPDVDWTPTWWLYMIATPFLTPFIVAPIYLIQRHRHVGIPWGRLALWR